MSPEVVFFVKAPPGCSEHHTGRAVDIGTPNCIPLDKSFAEMAAFSWLQCNAMQFGFELSYPHQIRLVSNMSLGTGVIIE